MNFENAGLATLKAALAALDNEMNEAYLAGLATFDGGARHDLCLGIANDLKAATHGAAELMDLTGRLQQRLDQLTEWSSRRNPNAGKAHIAFWSALTKLWRSITTGADLRQQQHRRLSRFLLACSAPLFPMATTDKKLKAFIERNFPQTDS